jgi:hypothetical protein
VTRSLAAGAMLAALDAVAVVGLTLCGAGGALAMVPRSAAGPSTADRGGRGDGGHGPDRAADGSGQPPRRAQAGPVRIPISA